MLGRPSPAIQHCQNRAAECEHLAELASNPETKNGYLRLADCWHGLAGNHEFVERLDIFLGSAPRSLPNRCEPQYLHGNIRFRCKNWGGRKSRSAFTPRPMHRDI
jgi:hypothetical protein